MISWWHIAKLRMLQSLTIRSTKSVDKLPSGSQLFGFGLLSTFEIIVRLHEKKPGTVAIADRTRPLKILFRSIPQ